MSMDADGRPSSWLFSSPSSRSRPPALGSRCGAACGPVGATTMVTSVWVLPGDGSARGVARAVAGRTAPAGRDGFVLSIPASTPDVNEAIVSRFRDDRGREYDEFVERCAALLDEIGKEGEAGKYTFAELEESEQDLEKLVRWLAKIQARDFFPMNGGRRRPPCWHGAAGRGRGFLPVGLHGRGSNRFRSRGPQGPANAAPASGLDPARVNGERPAGIRRRERLVGHQGCGRAASWSPPRSPRTRSAPGAARCSASAREAPVTISLASSVPNAGATTDPGPAPESTRTPGPEGGRQVRTVPPAGAKPRAGSSA